MSIYTWLKSLLPVSSEDFNHQIDTVRHSLQEMSDTLRHDRAETVKDMHQQMIQSQKDANDTCNTLKNLQDLTLELQEQSGNIRSILESDIRDRRDLQLALQRAIETVQKQCEEVRADIHEISEEFSGIREQHNQLLDELSKVKYQAAEANRYAAESVWGEIFNQTIRGSTWLHDTSFSPGRWAIGYQYLYALYRILNEVRPKRILELGLGQSTKMISQYAMGFEDVFHEVVEHDPDWISFFSRNFSVPEQTKIIQLDREFIPYKEAERVRVFKGFCEQFRQDTFDFISIDAPLGGDMKDYARIDVLQLIPDILASEFIIMIDDCNRIGEQHTVQEMENRLRDNQIEYYKGQYSGHKDCVVLASKQMKFVCTM